MKKQTYPKSKKLKSSPIIKNIFVNGHRGFYKTLSWHYCQIAKTQRTYRVGFSVSKRHFPKAVSRNRIKRLMREAFRLQQDKVTHNYAVMYVYIGKQLPLYPQIYDQMEYSITVLNK